MADPRLVKGVRLLDRLGAAGTHVALCDPAEGWVMVRRQGYEPQCVRVSAIGKKNSRWQIKERK